MVQSADNEDVFERIMDSMLERASWCSGDPLCISATKQGYENLNYAACHDCTLLPETSCEITHKDLDKDLENNYELFEEYKHKCSKCQKTYTLILRKEIISSGLIKCPQCKVPLELIEFGRGD